jgi:hypothetical protein
MTLKILERLFVAALVCCLWNGCRSNFHLVLFNNTEDTIIIHRRTLDATPLVVVPGVAGEITGVSTDDFILETKGRLLHYQFPVAYTFPSAAVPPGYVRRVRRLGPAYYFQLAPDDRIYILRPREPLQETTHAAQPAGFPLLPH